MGCSLSTLIKIPYFSAFTYQLYAPIQHPVSAEKYDQGICPRLFAVC